MPYNKQKGYPLGVPPYRKNVGIRGQLTKIYSDIQSAIRSHNRDAIRMLIAKRRPLLHIQTIDHQSAGARYRLKSEFCFLKKTYGKDNIQFCKKYDIYMHKRISNYKDYKKYFNQCAKAVQDIHQFRRAALLRSQSSAPVKNFDIFRHRTFESLIDWETIKQIRVGDISLSFMIKRKNDSKKNILFIIPYNYPSTPPTIFINGTPLRDCSSKNDVKVQLAWWMRREQSGPAPSIMRSALTKEWSHPDIPVMGIEQCVQVLETFLDEIPLKK